jgi:hypothetical protein
MDLKNDSLLRGCHESVDFQERPPGGVTSGNPIGTSTVMIAGLSGRPSRFRQCRDWSDYAASLTRDRLRSRHAGSSG